MSLYIVGSGDGYFIQFDNGCPLMDSDPICATRMEEEQAGKVIERLEALNLTGRLVSLVFAKIRPWEEKQYVNTDH